MIVRRGLAALPGLLAELGLERPLLVTTSRWCGLTLPIERRFSGARPHADLEGVRAAVEAAEGADGLVALGGGSAIDTAKAVSAQTGLRVVSIPTTYSGAEWTDGFGVRDAASGRKVRGSGALVTAVVLVPELTVGLPRAETAGSAMNALAHCAEALYTREHRPDSDEDALAGARLLARSLPAALDRPDDLEARRELLEGAALAGAALRAGTGVGHAMAQALGGRLGLSHGAMNAVCLPAALRFNREVAADALARLGRALDADDPVVRVEELAGLGVAPRLRDHGVPREELPAVAAAAAERAPARQNPRLAPPPAILELLEEVF